MSERKLEVHAKGSNDLLTDENFGKSMMDMPYAAYALCKNPTYGLSLLATVFDAFCVAGFSVFFPKVIEHQFHLPAGIAAALAGGGVNWQEK